MVKFIFHQPIASFAPALEGHFWFAYTGTTIAELLLEEDHFALALSDSESCRKATATVAEKAATYFGKAASAFKRALPEHLNKELKGYCDSRVYASLDHQFTDFESIMEVLRTGSTAGFEPVNPETTHMRQLAMLWIVAKLVKPSVKADQVDLVYRGIIAPTKGYRLDIERIDPQKIHAAQFGNSGKVEAGIFSAPAFVVNIPGLDYVTPIDPPLNQDHRDFNDKGIPFIYGFSGVANRTMRLLDTLGITPDDPAVGRDFCNALAAYIVGSKIHSLMEVYEVFNYHLSLIDGREQLKKMVVE